MPNEFYVEPAGGQVGQGLAGLGAVLGATRARREEQEKQAAAEQRQREMMGAIFQASQAKDPTKWAEVVESYPEAAQMAMQGMGAIEEWQRREMAQDALKILSNPAAALQELDRRISVGQSGNRDMSHSQEVREMLASGDTEGAMREAEAALIFSDLDMWKAWKESRGVLEKPTLGIVQRFTPDGVSETILTDNKGSFFDLQGTPIQLAREDRIVEGSSLTGSEDDIGMTDAEGARLRDSQVSTMNFVDAVGDAIDMLDEAPDINTFMARAAATVNDMQQEASAAARALGFTFDEDFLDPAANSQTFDTLGIKSEQMRGLITSLAYQAAAANSTDGRVSDRDFKNFVMQIGGQASDPRAFKATLEDVAARTERNFRNNWQVRMGEPFAGALSSRATSAGIQEGATATNPSTGERLVFRNGNWEPL